MRISDWSSDVCSSDLTYVKVAFFAAAFICFPVFLTQLWRFVAPGLYKHEKSAFLPFLVATPFLFFLGGGLGYYIIFPMAATFFIGFEVRSEEHTYELQSLMRISYAVFCLKKKIYNITLTKLHKLVTNKTTNTKVKSPRLKHRNNDRPH